MKERVLSIFNIRPGERTPLLLFTLILFANMLSLETTFVVATSGFLSQIGVEQVPILWLVDMTIILVGTAGYSLVIDRLPRKTLLQWLIFSLAMVYLLIRVLFTYNTPDWLTYPLLYLLAEQQFLLVPIIFWALANDVYNVSQTKRLFPIMAAGGVIGGILGNTLAASSADFFIQRGLAPYELLLVNALILLISFATFQIFGRQIQTANRQDRSMSAMRETLKEGWDFVKNVDTFRYLTIVMLGMGFALTILEFHFLTITSQTFEGLAFQTFYGWFRVAQTVAILLMQGLIASRIINRVGLKKVFSVLPVSLVVLTLGVLAIPGAIGIITARLLGRVFLFGLDEPARKSLQGLIPDERRGRVSAFLDGYLYATGTIVASLILIALLAAVGVGWLSGNALVWVYLVGGVVIGLVSIWAAQRLRVKYDTSMLNWRLARRRRRSSNFNLDF